MAQASSDIAHELHPIGTLAFGTVVRLPNGTLGCVRPSERVGWRSVKGILHQYDFVKGTELEVVMTPERLGQLYVLAPQMRQECAVAEAVRDLALARDASLTIAEVRTCAERTRVAWHRTQVASMPRLRDLRNEDWSGWEDAGMTRDE